MIFRTLELKPQNNQKGHSRIIYMGSDGRIKTSLP